MQLTSPIFLTIFLPFAIGLYCFATPAIRRFVLIVASLAFYAWGEPKAIALLVGLAFVNWLVAFGISGSGRRLGVAWLTGGIMLDLLVLVVFKYWGFAADNLSAALMPFGVTVPTLNWLQPLGVSFYVFQAISYLMDVRRKLVTPERKFLNLLLYFSFFPKMVSGPIVRYLPFAEGFARSGLDLTNISEGLARFCIGLSKKVLIADTLALIADPIFSAPVATIPCFYCWLGILAYTLQIYFDFSGCTDMAIGIARVFNFTLPENFDFPYSSCSVQEFWRRWHISLSTWFRDYLYIPLGGNRKGAFRTYLHMCIVFLLCGLWHGPKWSFVAWGAYHGIGLAVERAGLKKVLERMPRMLSNAYVMLFVIVGWVFFRAPSLADALTYLRHMFGGNPTYPCYSFATAYCFMDYFGFIVLAAGAMFSYPVCGKFFTRMTQPMRFALTFVIGVLALVFAITGNANPSMYGKF